MSEQFTRWRIGVKEDGDGIIQIQMTEKQILEFAELIAGLLQQRPRIDDYILAFDLPDFGKEFGLKKNEV